jgi:hypothetical protein
MAPSLRAAADELLAALERDHERARGALEGEAGPTMAGVVWLSAHLAAVEHAIQPHAPDGVGADGLRAGRELKQWLRLLERQLAGDQTAPDDAARTAHQVLLRLDDHAERERALVVALGARLSDDELVALRDRYSSAVEDGPTRPHPHGTHAGRLEPVVYAFNRAWDHLVDAMDGRVSPLPHRERRASRVGRWGRYLLGINDEQEFDVRSRRG